MKPELSQLLKEALEASETGYYSYQVASDDLFLSDRFYVMLGHDPGAFPMTIKTIVSLLHPDDVSAFSEWFRRSLYEETGSFQGEFRLHTHQGGWKWIQARGKVVERYEDGSPRRSVGTLVDVTQRKLVERALAESEARWNILADQAPVGISLVNRDGQVLFVNRHEEAFHKNVIVGQNWKDLLPEELQLEANWVLERGFEGGETFVFETYRSQDGGKVVRSENHASPVRDENGLISALLIVSLDITARHQARRRQTMASRRMALLLALQDEGSADEARVLAAMADGARELSESSVGYVFLHARSSGQAILQCVSGGNNLDSASPPVTASLDRAGLVGQVILQARPVVENNVPASLAVPLGPLTPHTLLQRFAAVPIVAQGAVIAVVAVANKVLPYDEDDVTEMLTLAEALWQYQQRLAAQQLLIRAQKMETVGQLAAGVAHDFNNLLTSVLAFNTMLLRKLEPESPMRVYAEKIDRSATRAADLVAGLLAVGRQQRLAKTRVNLDEILRGEEALLSSLASGQLRLEPEIPGITLPVEVDAGQISQVILNLVSNARDALGDRRSPIEVTWGRRVDDAGAWAWFAVEDHGPGIPGPILDRIFDPFFTTKPIGKGTGLGLSIVLGIVQQHQGTITVKSTLGSGTRFLVSLPLVESEPSPTP